MTIRLNDTRKPLGYYTWVAICRDGSEIYEFPSEETPNGEWLVDHPQVSFDVVAKRDDIAQVYLIPVNESRHAYIRIDVQPGEWVTKKWIRTFTANLDQGGIEEKPVIDSFALISEKTVRHYAFPDGSVLITTSEEP